MSQQLIRYRDQENIKNDQLKFNNSAFLRQIHLKISYNISWFVDEE